MEIIVRGALPKLLFRLAIAIGVMLTSSAFAASYNIILKTAASTNIACATGGFSFTKTTAGTFPTSGASEILTGCTAATFGTGFPAIANGTYSPGSLSVVVQNITTPQPQGPNVEGLTGTLTRVTNAPGTCQGTGSSSNQKTYTLTFSYGGTPNTASRTFTLSCAGPGNLTPISGHYDVRNTASVPEPETLLLVLAGLGGYKLVMARRRKRIT